jgi:hypothetical protein
MGASFNGTYIILTGDSRVTKLIKIGAPDRLKAFSIDLYGINN